MYGGELRNRSPLEEGALDHYQGLHRQVENEIQ
jgi:hypothetical protein